MSSSTPLTEIKNATSFSTNHPVSFYKNPSVCARSDEMLQKISLKNQKIREIEFEELKMIRNLNNWKFLMKNKPKTETIEKEQKQDSTRAKKFLVRCESLVNKKISDVDLEMINSILYDCSNKTDLKNEEASKKRVKLEVVNSFQAAKASNSNSGIINNDNNRFLLYESVKNSILREGESHPPECEQLFDRLKVAAYKILHNFSHLKGTMNEKYLNYGLLEEETNKRQTGTKLESIKETENKKNGNNLVRVNADTLRIEKGEKVIINVRKLVLQSEDLMTESKNLELTLKELKEEQKRLAELLSEIDKRSVR